MGARAATFTGTTAIVRSVGDSGGGTTININAGALMGNETDARASARRITEVQWEERRIGRYASFKKGSQRLWG